MYTGNTQLEGRDKDKKSAKKFIHGS